jgi:hypothetical protein
VTQSGADSNADKSASTLANELAGLVVAYAKQETLDPLRNLGRFVAFGIAGAVLFAVGGTLLILTGVRVLQTETGPHLHGDFSWVPYTGGMVLALVVVVLAITRITKGLR